MEIYIYVTILCVLTLYLYSALIYMKIKILFKLKIKKMSNFVEKNIDLWYNGKDNYVNYILRGKYNGIK